MVLGTVLDLESPDVIGIDAFQGLEKPVARELLARAPQSFHQDFCRDEALEAREIRLRLAVSCEQAAIFPANGDRAIPREGHDLRYLYAAALLVQLLRQRLAADERHVPERRVHAAL